MWATLERRSGGTFVGNANIRCWPESSQRTRTRTETAGTVHIASPRPLNHLKKISHNPPGFHLNSRLGCHWGVSRSPRLHVALWSGPPYGPYVASASQSRKTPAFITPWRHTVPRSCLRAMTGSMNSGPCIAAEGREAASDPFQEQQTISHECTRPLQPQDSA